MSMVILAALISQRLSPRTCSRNKCLGKEHNVLKKKEGDWANNIPGLLVVVRMIVLCVQVCGWLMRGCIEELIPSAALFMPADTMI